MVWQACSALTENSKKGDFKERERKKEGKTSSLSALIIDKENTSEATPQPWKC